MSQQYVWTGQFTAVSSIVHVGEALGTVRYLRRERFLLPDGTSEDVPVLSGNMLRGVLRRTAADLWWEQVGRPQMPLPLMHAIWGGGAMAKSTTESLTAHLLQRVRQACPVIGLFGTAGGGRVVDGTVQVGKAIPVCAETAHVRGGDVVGPSVWDITQIEYLTKTAASRGVVEEDTVVSGPMRFGIETFLSGTVFDWRVAARWADPVEVSLLAEALDVFARQGQIGGWAGRGYGQVRLELTSPDLSGLPDWRAALPVCGADVLPELKRLG